MNIILESSHAAFDRSKFLSYTEGCEEIRNEIISSFVKETGPLLGDLEAALHASVLHDVRQLLHKLKSSVGLFCTDALYQEISRLEHQPGCLVTPEHFGIGIRIIHQIKRLLRELQLVN